jgi:hypothetical protein
MKINIENIELKDEQIIKLVDNFYPCTSCFYYSETGNDMCDDCRFSVSLVSRYEEVK